MALGLAAVVLGFWGTARVDGGGSSFSDTVYGTIQLFYVNAPFPEEGTPWQLDAARFLAPAVVLFTVLATVIALTHERTWRWYLRHYGSGHLLIIGIGERGARLARTMRSSIRDLESDETGGLPKSSLRGWLQARMIGHVVALERDEAQWRACARRNRRDRR